MDKQTLSQYGWVVICILVLAVMIGMATPFGDAIKGSVNDTVTVMDGGASSALDDAFDGEESGTEEVKMLDGDGQVYEKAMNSTPLTFRSSATYDENAVVVVDGVVVNPDSYVVKSGSTKIEFKNRYTKTLSAGDHTIEIQTVNGNADADFTVSYTPGFYDENYNLIMTWDEFKTEFSECFNSDYSQIPDFGFFDYSWANKNEYVELFDKVCEECDFGDIQGLTFNKRIAFPEGVKKVGKYSLSYSPYLEELRFNGIEEIGEYAFADNHSISKIELPTSLTKIGDDIFEGCFCVDLTIEYDGTMSQWNEIDVNENAWGSIKSATVHCSDGIIELK